MIKKVFNNREGFTLIEILVALFVLTLIFTFVTGGGFTLRQKLDESLEDIERAIRFSEDEAALRNTITRVHFFLDEAPQQYAVEYGPDDKFIIPAAPEAITKTASQADEEEERKKIESINKKFSKVQEFQEKNKALNDVVRIVGVGSSLDPEFITDFHASLYIYPTGEKDAGFIAIATDEEVVGLSIEPFSRNFKREYQTIEMNETDELVEVQLSIAQEMFTRWLKQ